MTTTTTTTTRNSMHFFAQSADPDNVIKPYALMDLDDTLFQTQRKIEAWTLPTSDLDQLVCAAVNKQGEPLSVMTGRQQIWFNWLLASTDLIVVTARDTQEIKRVKLPFNSWQVLTHGAVILKPNGEVLRDWQLRMYHALLPLQSNIDTLVDTLETYNQAHGNWLRLEVHSDEFPSQLTIENAKDKSESDRLQIYLAVKHTQKDHQALQDIAQWLMTEHPHVADYFYIHTNANNLAIVPHSVHKKHAVAYLLENYLDKARPSFGFGDSLADLPFLQLLDWYGTPNHGQLHNMFSA